MFFELLVASFLVMLASLAGVVSAWQSLGRFLERHLDFLISFSAGVFAVIAYSLAVETLEHSALFSVGLGWIFAGAIGIWLLFKLLPTLHHHEHAHEEPHPIDARRVLVSDAFHNIGDGILLAASFAAGPVVGASAAIAVFVHELVQEISEFFVLRGAGYSVQKALWTNFAVSSTILIGAVGGYFALEAAELLEVPMLGLAAGMLLVVLLGDLIPHSISRSHSASHYAKHLFWFIAGLFLMLGVTLLVSESHAQAEDHPAESEIVLDF